MANYPKINNVNGPVYGSPYIPNWEPSSWAPQGLSKGTISHMNPNRNSNPINNANKYFIIV